MSEIAKILELVEAINEGQSNKFDIRPLDQSVDNLTPPIFVIEGLVIQGYAYTLTAKNNSGKSTLATKLIECVATGEPFGPLLTVKGRVLFLSGENHFDSTLKFKYVKEVNKIDLSNVDVIEASFDLKAQVDVLIKEAQQDYSLVVVDSLQAYFGEGDFNGNGDSLRHTKALRKLSTLRGNPAVIALAHPTKSAEILEPYGGGSAMNEIDSNFTLQLVNGTATLHHTKLRQSSFAPMDFQLSIVEIPNFMDNFGKSTTTTQFIHINPELKAERKRQSEETAKALQDRATRDGILNAIKDWRTLSAAGIDSVIPNKTHITERVERSNEQKGEIFDQLVSEGEIISRSINKAKKMRYKEITGKTFPSRTKIYYWSTGQEGDFFE